VLVGLSLVCMVTLAGCQRGPKMYRVKGHCFYKDGTVPKGAVAVVVLQPTSDSTAEIRKGANGPIMPDGSFEMWTRKAGDGVYQGEYDVGFSVLTSPMNPKSLVPDKYAKPGAAGLRVVVDRNISDLKFEIEPLPGVKGKPATG